MRREDNFGIKHIKIHIIVPTRTLYSAFIGVAKPLKFDRQKCKKTLKSI
jgi:hypothetical protein